MKPTTVLKRIKNVSFLLTGDYKKHYFDNGICVIDYRHFGDALSANG
jgi:hypothetical protein